jgi:Domain of unknown function (DUF4394)/Calx-beta domain
MNLPAGNFARTFVVLALLVAIVLAAHTSKPTIAAGSTTTFFLLTDDNRIAALTAALPSRSATPVAVSGLNAGDSLVAIDVRPQNGRLYGLGKNTMAGTVQLYHISPLTGVATAVGTTGTFVAVDGTTPVPITGTRFGMDFNPTVDRLRIATNTGQNFRMNPNTGAFIDGDLGGAAGSVPGLNQDGPINSGTTSVGAAAYTNNAPNVTVTTLYTLDPASDQLFIQNPPNAGTQTSGLAITLNSIPINFTAVSGFDIPPGVDVASSNAPATGAAFAMLTLGSATGLYQIELSTGVATLIGTPGNLTVRGLAVWSTPPAGIALGGVNTLIRFRMDTPGTTVTVVVTGLVAGETLVGIDGRPVTGQLYGLGINASANTGTLYRIDPQTGAATIIGTADLIALADTMGNTIDLPASSAGYGVDFNPAVDRIRVVTGTGLSFRVNPITGAPIDADLGSPGINPDSAINGLPIGSTGVSAAAYTNNYAGTTVTTLYTLDSTSNKLFIQNPPNAGTQTNGLALTLNSAPLDFDAVNGFDIPPGASVAASNTPATGNAYAILTVGGTTGLYRINLATGAATMLGALAATGASGFVVWSEPPAALFTTTATTISESAGTVALKVTSTGGAPLIASYSTGNGSATPGSDYTAISGTLVLGGGTISQTLSLSLINDTTAEQNETVAINLLGADGIMQTLTLTIRDDDFRKVYLPYVGND